MVSPNGPFSFVGSSPPAPGLVSAELQVSAFGVYVAELNGHPVHDHVLAPGWTSYHHRLRWQTVDVSALLREGPNCLGISVGEGWYRGRLGFGGGVREVYGADIAAIARLVLTYPDRVVTVHTDADWRASYGPILSAGLYDGEHFDARLEHTRMVVTRLRRRFVELGDRTRLGRRPSHRR